MYTFYFPGETAEACFPFSSWHLLKALRQDLAHGRLQQILQPGWVTECGIQRQNSFSSMGGVVGSANRRADGERSWGPGSSWASLSAGEWR